jgi:hypothetical protein
VRVLVWFVYVVVVVRLNGEVVVFLRNVVDIVEIAVLESVVDVLNVVLVEL